MGSSLTAATAPRRYEPRYARLGYAGTRATARPKLTELVGRAQADRFLRRPYREPLEYLATLTTEAAWKTLIISGDPLENCKDIAVQGDGEAVLALLDVTRLQAPIKPGP